MQQIEQIQFLRRGLLRDLPPYSSRTLSSYIDWKERLIGVLGPKGVGKTTLLLQRIKEEKNALYCSLDNPIMSGVSLFELATTYQQQEGHLLFLDEVHKYEEWSSHIKAIYDSFKNLKIVFSGSSALHLHKGKGDLSRRASIYTLPTLSFREFLNIEANSNFSAVSLTDVCSKHEDIAEEILSKVKPLRYFKEYLRYGSYPFYKEGNTRYYHKLQNVIAQTIESDLVLVNNLEGRYIHKLKKLLYVLATSVPYTPNMVELSAAVELSRPSLYQYLEYLEQAGLIHLVRSSGSGNKVLTKAEKIYLENTNLLFALGQERAENGTIRETFFVNQCRAAGHSVEVPRQGDFIVDGEMTFEVGGKKKTSLQIKSVEKSYVVSDDIEVGVGKKIPLWLFGFLY